MATLRLCAVASAFLGGTLTLLYFENYVVIKEKTNLSDQRENKPWFCKERVRAKPHSSPQGLELKGP